MLTVFVFFVVIITQAFLKKVKTLLYVTIPHSPHLLHDSTVFVFFFFFLFLFFFFLPDVSSVSSAAGSGLSAVSETSDSSSDSAGLLCPADGLRDVPSGALI